MCCVIAAHLLRIKDPATDKPLTAHQLKAEIAIIMAAGEGACVCVCAGCVVSNKHTEPCMQEDRAGEGRYTLAYTHHTPGNCFMLHQAEV